MRRRRGRRSCASRYAWPWKPWSRRWRRPRRSIRRSHGIPGASPPPTRRVGDPPADPRQSSPPGAGQPPGGAGAGADANRQAGGTRRDRPGLPHPRRSAAGTALSPAVQRALCAGRARRASGAASATDAEAVLPPRAGDRLARGGGFLVPPTRRSPNSARNAGWRCRCRTSCSSARCWKAPTWWRCCRRDWYASATGCGGRGAPGGARLRPGHALARALAPRSGPSLAARTHRRLGVTRRYASVVAAV